MVDPMSHDGSAALLGFGLPPSPELAALDTRLGAWPLLIKLVGATLRDLVDLAPTASGGRHRPCRGRTAARRAGGVRCRQSAGTRPGGRDDAGLEPRTADAALAPVLHGADDLPARRRRADRHGRPAVADHTGRDRARGAPAARAVSAGRARPRRGHAARTTACAMRCRSPGTSPRALCCSTLAAAMLAASASMRRPPWL